MYILFNIVAETMSSKEHEKQAKEELTEEFEDKEGNVFSRKTYQDLKRQGLL